MQLDDSNSEDASAYMAKALRVCDRLQTWATRPTNSTLIELAQRHLATLVARVRSLSNIIGLEPSVGRDLGNDQSRLIRQVAQLINEAIGLLSFCQTCEVNGHDGALNAVYARVYLLENDAKADLTASSWSKKATGFRIQQQLSKFHPHGPTPYAASGSHYVRLGSGALGPEGNGLEWLRHFLYPLAEDMAKQLHPRYIHSYATANEVPYRTDPSALPGSGSYGVVRKVVHRQWEDEPLADKTFLDVFSEAQRKKILREVGILEVCLHPNITAFVEAYEVRDQPHSIHLVMTPWAPYTLLQFLRSSDDSRATKCPWFQPDSTKSDICIYRVMHQIADAVRYLHGLSIKHKDIKPDNILLHREGTIRITPLITDVGVSKVYTPGGSTDYFRSSYQYLAPEQMSSQESSLKADIWQLGCCFAMLFSVALGGSSALDRLWKSFENTIDRRLCNIALTHEFFMGTLQDIYLSKNFSPKRMQLYDIVKQMLDLNPSSRIDIGMVMIGLDDLVGDGKLEDL